MRVSKVSQRGLFKVTASFSRVGVAPWISTVIAVGGMCLSADRTQAVEPMSPQLYYVSFCPYIWEPICRLSEAK